jgi:transcriptional regulator with XRE-family HTH domain
MTQSKNPLSWRSVEQELYSSQRMKKNHAEGERLAALADLRRDAGLTQVELARALRITQGSLSQLERQHDAKLSTLVQYVAGLGGELRIEAVFPDHSVPIDLGFVRARAGPRPEKRTRLTERKRRSR